MKYRINPKNGDKLSALGFGCMRFAKDEQEVERQIIYAIEHGVNYFDTAYIYPKSEAILGRVLAKGYRDRVKIATKMPPYLVKKYEDLDKLFETELERLRTYNDREIEGKTAALSKYIMQTSVKSQTSNASRCTKCGKCESHCPQNIKIRDELTTVTKAMEGFYYKPTRFLIKRFMRL